MQKEKDREKKQKKQTIRDWTNSRDSELKKKKKKRDKPGQKKRKPWKTKNEQKKKKKKKITTISATNPVPKCKSIIRINAKLFHKLHYEDNRKR